MPIPGSVWAPYAERVEIVSRGHQSPLAKTENGWWRPGTPLKHGETYAFRVNGEGPWPDPRSPWQPEGIDGPSRWVDHGRFEWTDAKWQQAALEHAIIYELHVGTFTPEGTFDALIPRLQYLADLGVTHVELMPVAEFSGDRGWGYDGVDLYAPHHAYGGPDALKRLVDAAHARGLAVLIDVVYNHLGPAGNYLARFGPYFTNHYRTPWGDAVNLDGPDSGEVRRFFIDNALMWLRDYHFDGLRIDAVHAIVDTSAIHFLEELAADVRALETETERRLVVIAESDLNDPRIVRPAESGGYGLDAQWNEDFHHAVHAVLTGERSGYYMDFGALADVSKVLTEGLAYDGRYSPFRRRRHGRPARDVSGRSFIGCIQNHDQIGNRALGDRIGALAGAERAKLGAALVLTSPFVPMLFQGEEWCASTPFLYFTDHRDPALGEAVRRGRREEFAGFGWNPEDIPDAQSEETFLRSKLNWDEMGQAPYSDALRWYASLIALRKQQPSLHAGPLGDVRVEFNEEKRWLVMRRGALAVAFNFADTAQSLPLHEGPALDIVLASASGVRVQGEGLHMPPTSVAVALPAAL